VRQSGRLPELKGVKAIAEEVEVRLANHQKHADDDIAQQAIRIWDIEVPHDRIHVKVENGADVDRRRKLSVPEGRGRERGSSARGTRGVNNLIRVVPPAG
jgi:hypothetical protein